MQILIACAKIMTGSAPRKIPFTTEPTFQLQANENAMQMISYSVEELMDMLHVNRDIAVDNWKRFQVFHTNEDRQPAVFSYDGMVFQRLAPESFSDDELMYANRHLFISSFMYGLLRPLDMISKYRLEGNVILPNYGGKSMFDFWKPMLTDWFIHDIKDDGGILVNLASDEMRNLFDWKRVRQEVRIVTPEFKVEKNGRLKTIVIYTKMCRGAMTRYILKNHITDIEQLKGFKYEGFQLDPSSGEWTFTLKQP
jgi:cytoplasmic iron level regulating protein YaaA (DUF328/UPF0246 family)